MKDIITELISLIKAEQQRIAESLTAGHAINIESYQRLVGNYQGCLLYTSPSPRD